MIDEDSGFTEEEKEAIETAAEKARKILDAAAKTYSRLQRSLEKGRVISKGTIEYDARAAYEKYNGHGTATLESISAVVKEIAAVRRGIGDRGEGVVIMRGNQAEAGYSPDGAVGARAVKGGNGPIKVFDALFELSASRAGRNLIHEGAHAFLGLSDGLPSGVAGPAGATKVLDANGNVTFNYYGRNAIAIVGTGYRVTDMFVCSFVDC